MFNVLLASCKWHLFHPCASFHLGSTDAAPEVPHPRPTRRDVATRRGRRCPRVRPCPTASGHVVFTDASRYGFDARLREPIRADSGLNRPESAGIGRNSRFRPKFKKKKKKNPERTVFTEIQNTLLTLRLTHFVSVLVCSLPLCFVSLSASLLLLNLVYVCIM